MREYCPKLRYVVWDRGVDKMVETELANNGISSRPIYSDFNYGSIVNKGLLLANEVECRYLVRIDPGTMPPACGYDTILKEHIALIDHESASQKQVVVSRGYEGRIAVRDIFCIPHKVRKHHNLVKKFTKVKVYSQITGGALFTSRIPGVPAIPFEMAGEGCLTLVWASDDGFFQLLEDTRGSKILKGLEVPRFDPVGKPKTTFEYYRGLAGMVFLSSLIGSADNDSPTEAVNRFIRRLKPLLNEAECQKNDEDEFQKKYNKKLKWFRDFGRDYVAPDNFLQKVKDGWENYQALVREWPSILKVLKGKLIPYIQIDS